MYGDTLGEAFVEIDLSAQESVSGESIGVITFDPATHPEIRGLDSAKDFVEVWVDPYVDVSEVTAPLKDDFILSTPFVDTNGKIVLTVYNGNASSRTILAGTKFRFKITRERSHNTGALAS